MYNYYRWFPQGKIVFMAPTRPLVAQQIRACYDIMAIPTKDTVEMTGKLSVLFTFKLQLIIYLKVLVKIWCWDIPTRKWRHIKTLFMTCHIMMWWRHMVHVLMLCALCHECGDDIMCVMSYYGDIANFRPCGGDHNTLFYFGSRSPKRLKKNKNKIIILLTKQIIYGVVNKFIRYKCSWGNTIIWYWPSIIIGCCR